MRIAEILSIERRTLWRWKTKDPDYRRVLAEARRQIAEGNSDRYQGLLHGATIVLGPKSAGGVGRPKISCRHDGAEHGGLLSAGGIDLQWA